MPPPRTALVRVRLSSTRLQRRGRGLRHHAAAGNQILILLIDIRAPAQKMLG